MSKSDEKNEKGGTNSNSEEYLKNYLDSNDFNESGDRVENSPHEIENLGNIKDLEFITLDISELPCSHFYPAGTNILVRPAKVSEIQAFSTIDESNFYDIYEKVNHLVSNCVFIKMPDQKKIPYINVIDGDRWYLLFVIRELTFQKGNDLYTEVGETKIPIKRGYFTYHEMSDKLKKYYHKLSGRFIFKTKVGEIEMAPPTIGLQKSFSDYMIKRVQSKKDLDQSFLKIIPYTLPGKTSITAEGINKKLQEFKTMDTDLFQFLNQAVEKMSFGISGVKSVDESGQEVRSDDVFPNGVGGLFIQSSAFDDFLE